MLTIPLPINGFIPTLNQMGYMDTVPDRINKAFMAYTHEQKKRVLEVGCAYGLVSVPLAKNRIEIVACDADERHLTILKNSLTYEEEKAITLIQGTIPHTLSFEAESFQAVLASMVLHFLRPAEILRAFQDIFQWLKPGGKFFATFSSPYQGTLSTFRYVFTERKNQNAAWPGVIEDLSFYVPERAQDLPSYFYIMDAETLKSIAEQTRFEITYLSYYTKKNIPKDIQLDGREYIGIICRKPLEG